MLPMTTKNRILDLGFVILAAICSTLSIAWRTAQRLSSRMWSMGSSKSDVHSVCKCFPVKQQSSGQTPGRQTCCHSVNSQAIQSTPTTIEEQSLEAQTAQQTAGCVVGTASAQLNDPRKTCAVRACHIADGGVDQSQADQANVFEIQLDVIATNA